MPPPRISVIIPTFNRRDHLVAAIDSVLNQTSPAHEIIVVDDGSTDGTADWLTANHPSILLLQQSNHGVSHARNKGIESASGDWVALLDSDDQWQPCKLERQLEALAAMPKAILCHTNEHWIRNGVKVNQKQRHQKHGGWIFEHCLPLCAISPSAAVIKRSLLLELGGFDESLPACEDYDLWLRITVRDPVLFIDQPLVIKHGGHDDQLSRQYWGMDRFRLRALAKLLRSDTASPLQHKQALSVFAEKYKVLQTGALKRNRYEHVRQMQRDYADLLCDSGAASAEPGGKHQ
ncbi:MAG: glycosyltransferase [Granulosicoccus sp.]